MATINISLPEPLKNYVQKQVDASGYGTVSEYFRELIREDQKRRAQARLETLLLEGLNSSSPTTLTKKDMDKVRQAMRARLSKPKK